MYLHGNVCSILKKDIIGNYLVYNVDTVMQLLSGEELVHMIEEYS